jgi:protein-L-isoaspartate(D-aspartate) O-methyltransferase
MEYSMQDAQFNMVEQQIRPWNVSLDTVLHLFKEIRREDFVAEEHKALAYTDMQLPIGKGQVMLEPRLEARILDVLNIQPQDTVMEVGTGSGFFTALLCGLAKSVFSVDIHENFTAMAQERLKAHQLTNVSCQSADALDPSFSAPEKFDVIILTGSSSDIPNHLVRALNPGGKLFAFLQADRYDQAVIVSPDNNIRYVLETSVPPLIGGTTATLSFVF